jgi:hypothetical protein
LGLSHEQETRLTLKMELKGEVFSAMRAIPSALFLICFGLSNTLSAQVSSPYTISGDLRDEAGQPLPGASVCALQTNGRVVNVRDKVCAESDPQGKFVINLTTSGSYQVVAEKMSEGYMPPYLPFYKDPKTSIPEVVLSGEHASASVSVTLGPRSGLITGKVIDEATDLPVRDFVVWTWQARDVNARTHQVVKGQSGRFRIFASPVSFRMRVVSEGYEDWVMGGGVLTSLAGSRKGPGSMLVRTGGNAEFAVYLKKKNPSPIDSAADAKRLPAPVQLSPQDNQIFDVFPRNTKLEWNPVAGAVAYAVEIESCWPRSQEEQKRLPDDGECINPAPYEEKFGLVGSTYEFFFKGAQPGRWRVWAMDKDHRPGIKSPWRRFIYTK